MARYTKRDFQVGEYWLSQREGSAAYYRTSYDAKTRRTIRVSLGTEDGEAAKQALTEYYLLTRKPVDEKPTEAFLSDVLRRYYTEHGSKARSKGQANVGVNHWLDFWETSTVEELRDITRQEDFHKHLFARGMTPAAVNRVIGVGKAALNRAWKRGELQQPPYIARVKEKPVAPRGRPMTVEELQKLYAAASPHLKTFMRWMLGTAARPEAILTLNSDQVSRTDRTIRLNPEGRAENKKRRPVVRLPDALAKEQFNGSLIQYKGEAVGSLKTAWKAARVRAGLDDACKPYSLRHTASKWMRKHGVSMDEVGQQLGHREKGNAVTAIYTADDPAYLEQASKALNALVSAVCAPVARQQRKRYSGTAKQVTVSA
ncbi:tyrosine-type recombinase/integrase [Mesorhizobium sp. ES1-1]|uniref:tyrosine-type recombinase/integrase n=1 Tax=Mesorhizobium sp. ES1-1 TaxID=2876629 RepID=UPI001CCCA85F|nr:tyrosine-type recombinase/integrase [Mesorhizobium sp. ES1-1]MBZ9674572.1 tyrosine-type recombinase/integrase [Mesorhizobium sp. ES1-1]